MTTKITKLEYTHLPLDKSCEALAGYYIPEQEVRLLYKGREVLYVTGQVIVESTCASGECKPGSFWYATVPGYILSWQNGTNEHGYPTTEVEQITDEETREKLRKLIFEKESVIRVDFW